MRTGLKKWTAASAVVLVGAFGLTACGSDEADGGGDTSVVGEEADTELTQENFFQEITAAQLEAGTSHVVMQVGAEGQEFSAEGDIISGETAEDTAMAMTMDLGQSAGQVEMRLVDNVFYMNFGPMTQNKFAEIDLEDENNPLGQQFGSIVDNVDPAQQLEQLEGSVTGFEQNGDAIELDGVQATPYEVTVDSSALTEGMGAAAEDLPEGSLPEEITYSMFVGPDNLIRRMVIDVAGTATQLDFTKWGEDVTIEKPADDEISDEDPFGQLGGAAG